MSLYTALPGPLARHCPPHDCMSARLRAPNCMWPLGTTERILYAYNVWAVRAVPRRCAGGGATVASRGSWRCATGAGCAMTAFRGSTAARSHACRARLAPSHAIASQTALAIHASPEPLQRECKLPFVRADGLAPEAVDAHALALFLFAQSYMRQTQLQSTMDVWPASPGESVGGPGEPASPARRVPHTNSGAARPCTPPRLRPKTQPCCALGTPYSRRMCRQTAASQSLVCKDNVQLHAGGVHVLQVVVITTANRRLC